MADPQIALPLSTPTTTPSRRLLTNLHSSNPFNLPPSPSDSLTLGVDDKLQRNIYKGQYIKFASLLSPVNEPTENMYCSMEKKEKLNFSKESEKKFHQQYQKRD